MQGKFDNNTPFVDFELHGFSSDVKKTFTGIVDTGFNGFLKIPFIDAFPIGLILVGTETSTIADGSQSTSFSCLGTITLFGKQVVTSISVAPNCPILIGTQLLARLKLDAQFQFMHSKLTFSEAKIPPVKVARKQIQSTSSEAQPSPETP